MLFSGGGGGHGGRHRLEREQNGYADGNEADNYGK